MIISNILNIYDRNSICVIIVIVRFMLFFDILWQVYCVQYKNIDIIWECRCGWEDDLFFGDINIIIELIIFLIFYN